jgi:hypothetical protein
MLGVMQNGRDQQSLTMHYYQMKPANGHSNANGHTGRAYVRSSDIGELMYTLELRYDLDEDCYRGDQRYDVKLRHLIGMMPPDIVKKIFSKDKPPASTPSPAMPMPQAEWHVLELHPSHAMYMHAFLANKSDERPLPMMGMQKPYRFEYV